MNTPSAEARSAHAFRLGDFLRDQLRNIAPFITLLCLVVFFSVASPSFASLGNLENILQQVSVTAIIAVGLTFVILTAEIDLSVGAVANATAIVLTFFSPVSFMAGLRIGAAHTQSAFIGNFGLTRSPDPLSGSPARKISAWLLLLPLV